MSSSHDSSTPSGSDHAPPSPLPTLFPQIPEYTSTSPYKRKVWDYSSTYYRIHNGNVKVLGPSLCAALCSGLSPTVYPPGGVVAHHEQTILFSSPSPSAKHTFILNRCVSSFLSLSSSSPLPSVLPFPPSSLVFLHLYTIQGFSSQTSCPGNNPAPRLGLLDAAGLNPGTPRVWLHLRYCWVCSYPPLPLQPLVSQRRSRLHKTPHPSHLLGRP